MVPTTSHGKELEEPWGRKGEQDAQFELIFVVNVIITWCSLCSAINPGGKLYSIVIDYLRFFMFVEVFPSLLGKKTTFKLI